MSVAARCLSSMERLLRRGEGLGWTQRRVACVDIMAKKKPIKKPSNVKPGGGSTSGTPAHTGVNYSKWDAMASAMSDDEDSAGVPFVACTGGGGGANDSPPSLVSSSPPDSREWPHASPPLHPTLTHSHVPSSGQPALMGNSSGREGNCEVEGNPYSPSPCQCPRVYEGRVERCCAISRCSRWHPCQFQPRVGDRWTQL